MREAGSHRQRHSQNFKRFVESHEQNASPVPGRRLLESLGTCGREENAACSRAGSQHPWITQKRKAHQVLGSDTAAGLSPRRLRGGERGKERLSSMQVLG